MAIKPHCDSCNQELVEYGAIVLSPPSAENQVIKYHLCVACYDQLCQSLNL